MRVNAGRPLVFNWRAELAPAILVTWWLGREAGNANAQVPGEVDPVIGASSADIRVRDSFALIE